MKARIGSQITKVKKQKPGDRPSRSAQETQNVKHPSPYGGSSPHGGETQNDTLIDATYVVIMAGGKGERFWPLSTDRFPKPFLKLFNGKSLIQHTVERAMRMVPVERICVVLGEKHLKTARKQLRELPDENFIVEPEGKNTAPCIGYSAQILLERNKEALMVTLPADHYIDDTDGFAKTIFSGMRRAAAGDCLVTIGIKPSRPETGYGYIHAFQKVDAKKGLACYRVNRFVEKPDLDRAMEYVTEGNYYWNAGIFIWKAQAVLKGIERHMPELYRGLLRVQAARASRAGGRLRVAYSRLPKESIDYGLMEKADNVLMVPSRFAWDDVGTWSSLTRVFELDEDRNYTAGNIVRVDAKNCVILSDDTAVGVVGVSDLAIVVSKNGVLVCDLSRAQEVREIARKMEDKKARG